MANWWLWALDGWNDFGSDEAGFAARLDCHSNLRDYFCVATMQSTRLWFAGSLFLMCFGHVHIFWKHTHQHLLFLTRLKIPIRIFAVHNPHQQMWDPFVSQWQGQLAKFVATNLLGNLHAPAEFVGHLVRRVLVSKVGASACLWWQNRGNSIDGSRPVHSRNLLMGNYWRLIDVLIQLIGNWWFIHRQRWLMMVGGWLENVSGDLLMWVCLLDD